MTEPRIEDLPNSEPPADKELSSSVVKSWLRKHELIFMDTLEVFAEKHELGFQEMTKSGGWEELFKNKSYTPDQWKRPTGTKGGGEFTGAGLCAIANGVIEEVLRNKYGNQLEVQTFFFVTSDMDIETDKDIEERPVHPHHIVRFRVPGEEWYTIDAVYRQFQFKVKPRKMLIIPTKNEKRLYTYEQWYQRMLDGNSDEAWKYLPQKRKPRELHEHHLEQAKNGKLKGITEEDYMSLFEPFQN